MGLFGSPVAASRRRVSVRCAAQPLTLAVLEGVITTHAHLQWPKREGFWHTHPHIHTQIHRYSDVHSVQLEGWCLSKKNYIVFFYLTLFQLGFISPSHRGPYIYFIEKYFLSNCVGHRLQMNRLSWLWMVWLVQCPRETCLETECGPVLWKHAYLRRRCLCIMFCYLCLKYHGETRKLKCLSFLNDGAPECKTVWTMWNHTMNVPKS